MKTYKWYKELKKPSWAPPAWLFGPVWTFLYLLILISFGYVVYLYVMRMIAFAVLLPFLLNIIFNISFTPLQFKIRSNMLAMIDVILVWVTLVVSLVVIYPIAPWVSVINIPYVIWVTFASILQITITYLNRKKEIV